MRQLWHVLLQALISLRNNRLRSALSVAGIAFGVAAVIAVTTLSAGGNQVVRAELETFGLRSVWLYRDWQQDKHRRGPGIDHQDLQALQTLAPEALHKLSPIVRHNYQHEVTLSRGNRQHRSALQGVNEHYAAIANDQLAAGRTLAATDMHTAAAVAVIGSGVAHALFGADNPLGADIHYLDRRIRVVGVLRAKSRDFLASIGSAGGRDANSRVLLPFTWVQALNGDQRINTLQAEASSMDSATAAGEYLQALLTHRNSHRFHYRFETMAQHIATADRILNGVALVGLISACISLLVGGIGIASTMSTAVVERTAEIGLRRAVGARRRDIQGQFLLEAMAISLLGGVIGLLVGGGASYLLALQTRWPLIPSATAILAALCVAVGTGLIAGYLPARRAALLHPVQALRL